MTQWDSMNDRRVHESKTSGTGVGSLTVVMPARNRARLIGSCLKSLLNATMALKPLAVTAEIVVADDASTDETAQVVERIAESATIPVRCIHLPSRQGPGRARNAAIEAARGELIVFVDSDVVVEENFLAAHVAAHQAEGPNIFTVGRLISVPTLEVALSRPQPTVWDFSSATLDTANAAVRKVHLEAVGAFDKGFEVMGWQDIDLGRRLKQLGLTRVATDTAVGYHIQPPIETRQQLIARMNKERERGVSAVYFMKKYPGLSARLAAQDTAFHKGFNWICRLGGLIREENVLAWVAWARRRGYRAFEKMWLAGVINQAYLESLAATRRASRQKRETGHP
ncbi:MAG: glycosyltransferase family 2 protein [Firmicutes bacterium]|nr:glycosyltransferase family 2 protein [Bacillota bacterium]